MAKDSFLVGLIGSGIGPSLSPALHEREADRQGLRYLYRLIDIDVLGVEAHAVGDLVRAARDLGFDGLNITHPCKQLVIDHLDALDPRAEALGAVNTVVFADGRATGHNTDVTGFAASFARGLPDAPLERVVQLGAGGAGAAVAHATLTLGAGRVTVVDALPERAADLAASLNRHFGVGRADAATPDRLAALIGGADGGGVGGTVDGLVHATPTGMAAHPGLPLPAELLHPGLWVAEVVYRPLETELLRTARATGCATLDGGGMAVFQAADAFRLFTGREPDTTRMLADIAQLAGALPAPK
ncbi:shikimate dehydrogenase [Streptomyces sp. NRRL WC-3618]|uniref:shikimate dehydrogenase n=1 Tax=Streptomyces sp. NRRL WC-3618 TaxID=1519490 RepID=UPI0006AFFE4F|nr:shikimate dehydrogenase [Streptomyces sp. NRRL WC-3618]